MMYRRAIATLTVASLLFAGTVGAASTAVTANNNDDNDNDKNKVTICHATSSATNPYVAITISQNAVDSHLAKHDGDFVAHSVTGCTVPPVVTPTPSPSPTPTPTPGPFVECVVGPGVTQTATTVTGTSGDDTIDCTNASPGKTITGGDGNDTITGTAFNDVIDAGNGNDTVTGGPGDDVIEGGNGNDTLTGSDGDDIVVDTGDGNDTITP